MTREEVLKIVSDAREKWMRANLTEADLTRADLTEANLSEANMRWANLSRANLFRADMYQANLAEANLTEADLTGANLRWTCLYGTTLPHRYIQIGPIGSRKDQIVYNADTDEIQAGCFRGTLDEFEAAVREKHKTNIHAREYLGAVRYLQEMREIQKTAGES